MDVQVVSQPRRRDLTFLPTEIEEHFAAQGCQLGLRKHSPDVLGMDYTIGWRPVDFETLPDDLQKVAKAAFELKPGGHLHRGDCLLAVRSFEARDAQREMAEEVRASHEDDARWVGSVEDTMQQLARSTGRSTGKQLLVGNVPHLTDHVLGGQKLTPVVEAELRRAGRTARTRA